MTFSLSHKRSRRNPVWNGSTRNHVHTSSGIISMGSFQAQLLHFLASERVVNDTSAQLGYTVPFKLDVVKKYNTELICNSI